MASLVLTGDTSGQVTIAAPAVAGTNTATLPAATGTVMVSGNMPAFGAYSNTNQTVSNNTGTVLSANTEEFDTASRFNNTGSTVGGIPAYAFLPNVAIALCLFWHSRRYEFESRIGRWPHAFIGSAWWCYRQPLQPPC